MRTDRHGLSYSPNETRKRHEERNRKYKRCREQEGMLCLVSSEKNKRVKERWRGNLGKKKKHFRKEE